MAGIDETRPFIPVNIAILTVRHAHTGQRHLGRCAGREDCQSGPPRRRACDREGRRGSYRTPSACLDRRWRDRCRHHDGRHRDHRPRREPEAFDHVLEKRIEGFGELFRMLSYQKIGTSRCSRVRWAAWLADLPVRASRQHRRGEGCLGRHTGVPTQQPVSPLQPGGADAAATGTPQDRSGVAARATIASRASRMAAPHSVRPGRHRRAPSRAFPHRKAALAHIRSATELPVRPAGRRVPPPWSARNRCRQ